MDLEKEKQRGLRAKQILEDEIFVETINTIKTNLYQEWINTPIRDSEGREKIFLMTRMFDSLLVQLKSVLETGKLATKQTDKQ
jgi:hypothetical protein|tara:strand:+ start:10686 stop:10934 length:249 start_codon:yes stop_codon:yes gene_type:complete